jgi:hypothetical protein
LAALIFVALDDLFLLYLLAGAGIVRAKPDPSCCASLILLFRDITWGESRPCWSVREILWFGSRRHVISFLSISGE